MQCVICKKGEVQLATIEAELKIGKDRLLVPIQAEVCAECGEAYYSTETMQYLEQVRDSFEQRTITPPSIGSVYQISE
jgi:YgiT-type zinc finger domain-containing protein